MATYTPTIGIEVHAELKTRTKMFCDSKNDPHHAESNTHICPVCMGHPGTLPTINKEAVRHVLTVGVALEAELATYTEFDRKNYFYPDIPKGYQISQYAYPLVRGGTLAGVAITRVHLEEDTARSLHDQGEGSIVDYNRAGVPLMELVTEPVIHDATSASNFAKELQLLLRTLGASDANMERGEMRVEANVSISATDTLGTKVEVKNLNSFRSVENAITYEIKRQTELLERGERIVQETRGWDENKNKTFSQRSKETSEEYRYFPDPDLPSLDISSIAEFSQSRLAEKMPEIPAKSREKYLNLGIPREQVEVIISQPDTLAFFKGVIGGPSVTPQFIRTAANYLTTDVQSLLVTGRSIKDAEPAAFCALVAMLEEGKITSRVAKDLLSEVLFEHKNPNILAGERGLIQNSSEDSLNVLIESIIKSNPKAVDEYRSGKESALQYLVGQGMRESRGAANPQLLASLIESKLKA